MSVGIITEQGDLGLGFDPLNQKDKKAYIKSETSSDNKKEDKSENK